MRRVILVLAALLATAAVAQAQKVETRITRDTIRVGDPFRAVIRIQLPPGTDIMLPDTLEPSEDVESAGKVRMRRDSTAGGITVAAAYPLTAWRTGPLQLPVIHTTLRTPSGRAQMPIVLPDINVVSVLPADTAGIKPKPAKDVLGPDRLWWPWILLAALIAIALGLLYWWWRRRRRAVVVEEPVVVIMPRERALEEIERIRRLGLIEQKEYKRFYTLLSEVVRQYMQTVDPAWSTYLTTEELHARTSGNADLKPAMSVLRQADMVKFARSIPEAGTASADLERARNWIAAYPAPVQAPAPQEKVA